MRAVTSKSKALAALAAMMLATVTLALVADSAMARTFYVDHASGADTNNGLAKDSPWKRHPYMQGFSGSYAPQAGDTFIFKGGVTWPAACFGLVIAQGGTAESPHVYTVDQAWYSGASWSRPVFDMEKQQIVGDRPIRFTGASYVTLDNIEIKNQRIYGSSSCWSWGGITVSGGSHITISNCYVHSWFVATPTVTADQNFGGIFVSECSGAVVEGCVIHGDAEATTGLYSGIGIWCNNGTIVRNCDIYNTPNGLHMSGGSTVSGSEIHHIYTSYDSGDNVVTLPNGRHANGVYMFGAGVFCNNFVHDILAPGAPVVFPAAGWGGKSGTCTLYNNVIRGNIHLNGDGLAADNDATYHIYNNIVADDSNKPIVASKKNDNLFANVTIKNNILIALGTYPAPINLAQGVSNLVIDNNVYYAPSTINRVDGEPCVLQLQWLTPTRYNLAGSQALGYNAHSTVSPTALAWDYVPATASDPGVDDGADLSAYLTTDKNGVTRPQGAAFDVGAYEYETPTISVLVWSVHADHAGTSVMAAAGNGYVEPRQAGLQIVEFECSGDLDPATVVPAAIGITGDSAGDVSSRIQSVTLSTSRTVRITLNGALPDGDTYAFTIRNTLRGLGGKTLQEPLTVRLTARCGDVDASGAVTNQDLLAIRDAAGTTGSAALVRYDIDCSGAVSEADMRAARAHLVQPQQ